MKQCILFGAALFVSLILVVLLTGTAWAVLFCFVGTVISFILGNLWKEMTMVQLFRMDGVTVEVYNEELSEREVHQYIDRARLVKPTAKLIRIKLVVDGEDVNITSEYKPTPFGRIKHIVEHLLEWFSKVNNAEKTEITGKKINDVDRDIVDILAEVNAIH